MARWMRWLLVASLALNLLVAGVLLGDALRGGTGQHGRPVALTLGPFARALGEEDRRAILDALEADEALRPPSRAERAAAFAEVLAAVRAEPFEPSRAEGAMRAQADRVAEVQRAVQAALVARLAAMPAEGRGAYADRLEGELRRGPGRD